MKVLIGFIGFGIILVMGPDILKLLEQPVVYHDVVLRAEGKPSVSRITEADGTPVNLTSDRAREILAGRYEHQFTRGD